MFLSRSLTRRHGHVTVARQTAHTARVAGAPRKGVVAWSRVAERLDGT